MISPPNRRNLHSRAFYAPVDTSDFTAEFEFNGDYWETGTGGAGMIFRASDVNHFYMVYFPWGVQQLRAKHFWAQLMKVEGDGYLRSLKSVWVPGVPSETDRWYKVRLEVKGPRSRSGSTAATRWEFAMRATRVAPSVWPATAGIPSATSGSPA